MANAPFKDWDLPPAMRRIRRKLERVPGGDRQMVEILAALPTDGVEAVEAACAEALGQGVHSADVVLNILARRRDPEPPAPIATPDALRLAQEPVADCARYDALRRPDHEEIAGSGCVTPKACLRHDEPAEARRAIGARPARRHEGGL